MNPRISFSDYVFVGPQAMTPSREAYRPIEERRGRPAPVWSRPEPSPRGMMGWEPDKSSATLDLRRDLP